MHEAFLLFQFIEGKYAMCMNCGMQSANYNTCEGCNRDLPDEPKWYFQGGDPAKKVDWLFYHSFSLIVIGIYH